jgi:hypothetical protein
MYVSMTNPIQNTYSTKSKALRTSRQLGEDPNFQSEERKTTFFTHAGWEREKIPIRRENILDRESENVTSAGM